MVWDSEDLFAKSRLFFEQAFAESPDDFKFGLWCSLGLELLARAAISSISPALLAEPDRDHKFLLHAFDRGKEKTNPQSIGAVQVFGLCQTLFENFDKDDFAAALALVNRRNAELHSAEAAFDEYQSKIWLPGFYRVCNALVKNVGKTLEELFGVDEASNAARILEETKTVANERVQSSIAAHRKVFEAKSLDERKLAAAKSTEEATKLSFDRHHKVTCPACSCDSTVQGEPFGQKRVSHENDEVVVRESISPRTFSCSACGLKLSGYAELDAAKLGGTYTRRTTYTPEDYFGLINPTTEALQPYIDDYLADMSRGYPEYDNE